jgi:uncharacterized OB-fold protein
MSGAKPKSNSKSTPTSLLPNQGRSLKATEVVADTHGNLSLNASTCKDCGLNVFPPSLVCPECLSYNQQSLTLSGRGKLYSYTQIHVAPPNWVVPYIIGYVDLPEGVRLFGKVDVDSTETLRTDMPVDVVVTEADGEYRYALVPAGVKGV